MSRKIKRIGNILEGTDVEYYPEGGILDPVGRYKEADKKSHIDYYNYINFYPIKTEKTFSVTREMAAKIVNKMAEMPEDTFFNIDSSMLRSSSTPISSDIRPQVLKIRKTASTYMYGFKFNGDNS